MVDTVVNMFVIVLLEIVKRERKDRNKQIRRGVKNGEHLYSSREMGVPDVFRKIGDHEFVNGVLNVDTIGDTVIVKREIGVGGDGGDWAEDESRGRGTGKGIGGSGSVKIVHDVVGGVSKLELVDFK